MTPEEARHHLIIALGAVRDRFDAGADDWQHSLLRSLRLYCEAIEIEPSLLLPLQKLLYDVDDSILKGRAKQNKGRPSLHLPTALAYTVAAAAVTVLHKRKSHGSVEEAAAAVAKASGLDKKKVISFRNNINSATATPIAVAAYPGFVQEIESWSTLETLKALPEFLRKSGFSS